MPTLKSSRPVCSIRHLQAVATVASAGNIRRAANAVCVSQSAVSQSIAKLERILGEKLFQRGTLGTQPTDAGRLFIGRIDRALGYLNTGQLELLSSRVRGGKSSLAHRTLPTTTQLTAFLEVIEQRSYTLAARWLGVSQPNVHRAIRDLEKFLGLKLFQLSPLGIEPTIEGRNFARWVGLAFREIEQGLDELAEHKGEQQGAVVVGCLPLGRAKILPTAVTRLLDLYPLARVKIVDGAFVALLDQLLRGKVDVILGALRIPPPAGGLIQETLFLEALSAVVRAGHPILKRTSVDARALAQLDWIVPHERTPARAQFNAYFQQRKVTVPSRLIECGSLIATRGLLMQSDRAALLSSSQIQDEIDHQALAIVPVKLRATERPIGLCYRADWQPTTIQAHLLSIVRDVVRAGRSAALMR